MLRPILLYYWLTPLFWLVDELFGTNVRAAALEGDPLWKALYYFGCLAIPAVAHYRPQWTARLAIAETSTNILLLALGVLLPYYRFIGRAAAGELDYVSPLTLESMVNFALSVVVLSFSLVVQTQWKRAKPFPR